MRKTILTMTFMVGSLVACEAPENGAPEAGPADGPVRAAEDGRRGMMDGNMGGMHLRMMGGEGDAPAAQAAPASAESCPDIDQALVDRGREVFNGSGGCTACHGADATGGTLAPDLTDDQWLNVDGSYSDVLAVIRDGVAQPTQYPAPMPPEGGATLSDAQLCATAAYVYSLSH